MGAGRFVVSNSGLAAPAPAGRAVFIHLPILPMAEQDEVMIPTPTIWYMSSVPTANGNIGGQALQPESTGHTLYQIQVNPVNPDQAVLVPAPGADWRLLNSFSDTVLPVFTTTKLPSADDRFFTVEKPTMLEKVGDNWKITEQGRMGFSATEPTQQLQIFADNSPQATQQAELTMRAEELAGEVATTSGATRTEAVAELEVVVNSAQQGPEESRATYADALRDEARAELAEGPATPEKQQPIGEGHSREQPPVASALAPDAADGEPVGELRITWRQKGDEVAPLLEMRAYLDQLKEAGVAVGALQLERDPAGKHSGSFGVSYDPESHKLGQLEAALQGFRQVGNGVAVVERSEQAAARRQEVGYDDDYEPRRSKQVREAFSVKQWDGLSAQLSAVPKHALTAPEQVQQAAAEQRVQQLAQQQGKTTEQVIRDGKSIFDIDTSGNPASAFLKNFYAHLNGGPKTRQNLEVDYEKTRQDLQARLTKQAGAAQPELTPDPPAPDAKEPSLANEPVVGNTVRQTVAPPAPTAALFQAEEVPQKVLASLGLNLAELAGSGQLQKLLSGEKTDLLPMQVAGKGGQEPVKFEGKMVLHREADGTATLKMELPQEKLVIPNEIGGQPFTPEQRQRLETEGNAGLIRGLKDEQGRKFNGYVAVDKAMNKVVVLPESKVTLHDTVAGVKLTPEQSHDLREGKVVALANMASGNGGQKFDGTVQVNAAKACIEVKPAAHELSQRQAPRTEQTVKATSQTVAPAPVKAETTQVKIRGPRH